MIGEDIGRGAYGNVFKGIDSQNGSTVAIKQISLNGTSTDNLQSVMGEIDLLKTLNHKNIVKYLGSFKTRRCDLSGTAPEHGMALLFGLLPPTMSAPHAVTYTSSWNSWRMAPCRVSSSSAGH